MKTRAFNELDYRWCKSRFFIVDKKTHELFSATLQDRKRLTSDGRFCTLHFTYKGSKFTCIKEGIDGTRDSIIDKDFFYTTSLKKAKKYQEIGDKIFNNKPQMTVTR